MRHSMLAAERKGLQYIKLCFLLTCCAFFASCGPLNDNEGYFSQRAYTIDGDSILIDGVPHHLAWIDAPEIGQRCVEHRMLRPCGEWASDELDKLLVLEHPNCEPNAAGSGEFECYIDGESLGEILLKQGAVIATKGAPSSYLSAEMLARRKKVGIWSGNFIDPAAWRKGNRLANEADQNNHCRVYAFRDENGDRLFVTPTLPGFDRIEHRSVYDARFCSDEAAEAAGYLPSVAPAPKD